MPLEFPKTFLVHGTKFVMPSKTQAHVYLSSESLPPECFNEFDGPSHIQTFLNPLLRYCTEEGIMGMGMNVKVFIVRRHE